MNNTLLVIFSLVLILFINDCSSNTGPVCCASPNADVEFSIVDGQGKNRLNPDHTYALTEQNLELHHVKEDGKQRFTTGIIIYNGEETYNIRLILSNYIHNGYTKTLLEFPNSTVDTLKMEPFSDRGSAVKKLWYDGELVYNSENPEPWEITKPVTTD